MQTGWTGEDERPAMPLTQLLLSGSRGGPVPGGVLEDARRRSQAAEAREAREAAALAPDPDEHAAGLIVRGYRPGAMADLSQRLGDTLAELEAERDKIERGRLRSARVMRDHAAGRLTVQDIARMDLDEGDEGEVARLEAKVTRLRRQIAEQAEAMMPREALERDAVEEAGRRSRQILADVARMRQEDDAVRAQAAAAMAGDRSAFYAARGGRPFVSSRRDVADAEPVCPECAAIGATPEESLLIHQEEEAALEAEAQLGTLDGESGRATWAPGVVYR